MRKVLLVTLLGLAAVQLTAGPAPRVKRPPLRAIAKDAFCTPSGIGYVCCYSCGFGNYCCAYYSCDATQGPCLDQDG